MAPDRNGNPQSCYYFDGTDDYIDLGTQAGDSVRSISLWFSPDESITSNITRNRTLIYRNNQMSGGPGRDEFGIFFSKWTSPAGRLEFTRYLNTDVSLRVESDNNSWEPNSWHHVVAVIDPASGMKLYIDNYLQSSTHPSTSMIIETNDPTYLGIWGNASNSNRFFKGWIDEVRLYNRALTPLEINKIHLSRKEKSSEEGLNIFPNPVRNKLNIDISTSVISDPLNVKLFNVRGQIIYQSKNDFSGNSHVQIPVSKLPKGIYLLQFQNKQVLISKKIIKE